MKEMMQSAKKISALLLLFGLIQGCASTGQMSGTSGWKEYSQDYEKMKSIVQKAIREGNLSINFVSESDEKDKITIVFSNKKYLNNESVQQDEGKLFLKKTSKGNSAVKIENPEYAYSVPEYDKKDYQRIIFNRIENILK